METTLGEQIMLLSLDNTTGAAREQIAVEYAVTGALLMELALADRVTLADGRIVLTDTAPLGLPGPDEALARIAAQDKPAKAEEWMRRLNKGAVNAARQSLIDKGLVREERKKVLGVFPVRRYPEADGSAEAAVREALAAVVLGGQEPDERTAALVVLLHGAGLHRLAFPDGDHRAAEKRMAAIAERHWAAPAVRQVVDSVRAAMVAIMASTTAAITVTGAS